MAIKKAHRANRLLPGRHLAAAGGFIAALAASSCCILPFVLFGLGVSGAWIGNLTALAPYQPYLVGAAIGCVGYGSSLVHRASKTACVAEEMCSRPLPNRFLKAGLIVSTVLLVAAVGFDWLAPLFLNS